MPIGTDGPSRGTYAHFEYLVIKAGFCPRDCGSLHWQILGGEKIVNYWQQRGTVYVQGASHSDRGCNVEDAILAAGKPKPRPAGDPNAVVQSTDAGNGFYLPGDEHIQHNAESATAPTQIQTPEPRGSGAGIDTGSTGRLGTSGNGYEKGHIRQPSPFSSRPISIEQAEGGSE